MAQVIEQTELIQLRSLLEAQTHMRELAEKGYADVVAILWSVTRAGLPEELDVAMRGDSAFEQITPKQLGGWISEQLTAKHHRLRLLGSGDLGPRLEAAVQEVANLREQVAVLQRERDELLRQVQQVTTLQGQLATSHAEAAHLRQQTEAQRREAVRSAAPSPTPQGKGQGAPSPEPEWLAEWRKTPGFELDTALVRVMGDTGYCLRASLAAALHRQGHLSAAEANSGTAARLFLRVKEGGLIDSATPQVEAWSGRAPELLHLTERGREAYGLLADGQEPQPSEYERLLTRRGSPKLVLLCLQARDLLLAHGAQAVDLHPQPLQIPGGGAFEPDIVATFDGRPLYVVCDRAGKRRGRNRWQRWTNYAAVTRDFYVVVPRGKAQSLVMTELNLWALDAKLADRITLHICNLAEKAGPLWAYGRELHRHG